MRERNEKITHITFLTLSHFLGLNKRNGFWGFLLSQGKEITGVKSRTVEYSCGTVILNSDTFNK